MNWLAGDIQNRPLKQRISRFFQLYRVRIGHTLGAHHDAAL
jgi:hypothetical protein